MYCIAHTAFCPPNVTESTRGAYNWSESRAEQSRGIACQYGGVEKNLNTLATRFCNERGVWMDPVISGCLTLVSSVLRNVSEVSVLQWYGACP